MLAGGPSDPVFGGGPLPKAFAAVAGRMMVEWVLDALRGAAAVGRVALVGPADLPPGVAAAVDAAVPAPGAMLDNLTAGLAAFDPDALVLASAADIPLLTPGAVDRFAAAAAGPDLDVGYAVLRREDVARRFPSARKTFVRFREGALTGGSLVALRPRAFAQARGAIERAIRARKRPWDLARLFGAGTLLGLLAGRLRVAALEDRVTRIAGIRARAIVCGDPEIGLDVDRVEDLAWMEPALRARAAATPVPAAATAGEPERP